MAVVRRFELVTAATILLPSPPHGYVQSPNAAGAVLQRMKPLQRRDGGNRTMAERANWQVGAPRCAPPVPSPLPPKAAFPPLACDCHAHICGPQATYGYIPERIYTPPDALLPAYQHLLAALGCDRAVLVQPSFHGTDNRAMIAAMAQAGGKFRGVAVLADDASERDIAALHAAGVRGARLNIVDVKTGKGELPLARIERLADRIKPFGWHIEFL